jgi:hypothetical protein
MRVLFMIPNNKPPELEGDMWSDGFKDFVKLCLMKEAKKVSVNVCDCGVTSS